MDETAAELPESTRRAKPLRVSWPDRWLTRRLLTVLGHPPITVVLWNGEEITTAPQRTAVRIALRERRTLWQLARNPLFQFGEEYAGGRIEVDGDLLDLLRSLDTALGRPRETGLLGKRLSRLLSRPSGNSLSASRQNIHHHYDIGNDFYKLWLDEQLVYTCAYFESPDTTLEAAQKAKMDHICRKLWLEPGETVVEAGCGWGALALHMARHYGVTVRAYNISHQQILYARERARAEGLDGRVEFIEDDWRNIAGECDAFVSVGMLEHVGLRNYRGLGAVIDRCLRPGGRGLIHTIGQNTPRPFDRWIERHIFPGAYPPTLRQMMNIFEPRHFSVLDIENLRLHYAQTLLNWLERFERSAEDVAGIFDERFVRMWRLYLAGSAAAFEAGRLQLFQVVFTREKDNAIPRTRRYQYAAEGDATWHSNGQDPGAER